MSKQANLKKFLGKIAETIVATPDQSFIFAAVDSNGEHVTCTSSLVGQPDDVGYAAIGLLERYEEELIAKEADVCPVHAPLLARVRRAIAILGGQEGDSIGETAGNA